MASQEIHAVIFKDRDSDQWVAMCLELSVVTQADSEEEAKELIKQAVELRLEDMTDREVEMLYQPVASQPQVHSIRIDAPTLLRTRG